MAFLALPALGLGAAGRVWGATAKRPLEPVDMEFIESRVKLIRRREWNGDAPKVWLLREAGSYDRVTLHHTGKSMNFHTNRNAVINDIDNIYGDHRQRNYGDIGYHFIIDYGGSIWEGRSLAYEGAHVSTQNERNIGVVLLGNFEEQEPSVEQLSSMKRIVSILRDHYAIKKHRIYGHRDLGPSVCPGRNLYRHVVRLKS